MALTKRDLQDIRSVVNEVVIDASHTILEGVQGMFDNHEKENKRNFQGLEDKLSTRIDNVEKHLGDDIDGLKADLSQATSKKELRELKVRMDKYHPVS